MIISRLVHNLVSRHSSTILFWVAWLCGTPHSHVGASKVSFLKTWLRGVPRNHATHGVRFAVLLILVAGFVGCTGTPTISQDDAAGRALSELEPVAIDGRERTVDTDLVSLGMLSRGNVINVLVQGSGIDAVLILTDDDEQPEAGRLAGGGLPNVGFDYRVPFDGNYYVFVLLSPDTTRIRLPKLTVGQGDPNYRPFSKQVVAVRFEDHFLTDPGLYDPVSGTADELAFLDSIEGVVRDGIMTRLRAIFADTPIEIVNESESSPNGPFSVLTFSPQRVMAAATDAVFDSALPATTSAVAECQEPVRFGEVLPSGTFVDPGNHVADDAAIVYVGSSQGRGESCRTAATNSVNNVISGLAQTGAHEIGHLIGLYHVSLVDIMSRSPSASFQRELPFQRGQILVEQQTTQLFQAPQIEPGILSNVIQDPQFYFQAAFGQ